MRKESPVEFVVMEVGVPEVEFGLWVGGSGDSRVVEGGAGEGS